MNLGVQQLEEENRRLARMAERDWLTGLYNRGATESRINQLLEERQQGVLFVLDVDNFKQVNDRYGHIIGDETLRKIAQILNNMAFREDIVGRVGGDEFVVYMPISQGGDFLEERCRQLKNRLSEIQPGRGASSRISVSVSGALYEQGDDYIKLFDRADQQLLDQKRRRKQERPELPESRGISMDIQCICNELKEQVLIPGAYCQDYETFKSIYRFVKRRLLRSKGNAYVILFTIMNRNGDFPSLSEREEQMDLLQEVIQRSLRLGDVFTQYTSCQYLVMVSDLERQDADKIAERVRTAFYETCGSDEERVLLHHCYPMAPAEVEN